MRGVLLKWKRSWSRINKAELIGRINNKKVLHNNKKYDNILTVGCSNDDCDNPVTDIICGCSSMVEH